MTRALGLIALVGLCAACPNAACDNVVGAPTVEVGTGLATFEPLVDEATLEVIRGAQGGFHVLGALRTSGVWEGKSPETWPEVDFELTSDDGAIVDLVAPTHRRLFADGDGFVLTAELVVLDLTSFEGVDGAPATLSARIADACGREASDERHVILTSGEASEAARQTPPDRNWLAPPEGGE